MINHIFISLLIIKLIIQIIFYFQVIVCMSDLMKDICACLGLIKCGQTKSKLPVNLLWSQYRIPIVLLIEY